MYAKKVVCITGGAGGIGLALARRFGAEGARIVLVDLREDAVTEAVESLRADGMEALPLAADITDADACSRAAAATVESYGGIDVLIHCAGLTQVGPFSENDVSIYQRVMNVNFFGAVYLTKAALATLLARRGQIIVLSSIAGFAPLLGRTGYCASKHALHGFFDTLRCELSPQGVGVLMVCPSFVDTPFANAGLGTDGKPLTFSRSTTGKFLTAEAVAEAIYQGARQRKRLLVLSPTGKLAWWVSRLFPGYYERQMTKRFAVELKR